MTDIDALWNFEDPAATEAAFRALLPEAEREGGASRLELLTQLARTQSLQRKFPEAHALLDQVQSQLAPDMTRPRIRCLLERGRTFNSAGQQERARPEFLEAWRLALEAGEDWLAVDAAHMLAIAESGDASLSWNEKAMVHAERSSDPRARKWLGSLHNNIGWTYHDLGRYDEALEQFQSALACREAQGQIGAIRIARWCVARCLRSLGRTTEALEMQRALLAEFEAAGSVDGYVFEELGECLLELRRRDEARPFFARAHAELSKLADRDGIAAERLQRLWALGTPDR
jgi:tetratricopeptide (TPR) repeat protein